MPAKLDNTTGEDLLDILGAIETPILKENNLNLQEEISDNVYLSDAPFLEKDPLDNPIVEEKEHIMEYNDEKEEEIAIPTEKNIETSYFQKLSNQNIVSHFIFGIKYILTSVIIFSGLLLTTNYSAYSNIVKSHIYKDENQQQSQSLLNSVSADKIIEKKDKKIQEKKKKIHRQTKNERINNLIGQEEKISSTEDIFSIKKLLTPLNKKDIDLGINIVPYENRIVIPKIGKNIPLIDIQETKVKGKKQLDNIFMKELEFGIVRYPGSAQPGEKGNSFIFGHSSNFPWIAGKYNDVFSRLGQVNEGDIVFSYYGQKKYKYKIKEKRIIKPTDVDILKRDNNKKELTLMTCWPIGTTLNRLILIGELVEE